MGKDNKGVFIQVAKHLKAKLKPESDDWNMATHAQLEALAKIEKSLVQMLELGVVRDYAHLKALIDEI